MDYIKEEIFDCMDECEVNMEDDCDREYPVRPKNCEHIVQAIAITAFIGFICAVADIYLERYE